MGDFFIATLLKEPEWFVFNVWILEAGNRRLCGFEEMETICNTLGIRTVPIEETGADLFVKYPSLDALLERAKGKYKSGHNKEGIVIRPLISCYSPALEGMLSFKVLNNDFLIKE